MNSYQEPTGWCPVGRHRRNLEMRNIKFLRPVGTEAMVSYFSANFPHYAQVAHRASSRRREVLFNNADEIYVRSVRLPSQCHKSTYTEEAREHFRFFSSCPPPFNVCRRQKLYCELRPLIVTGFNRVRYQQW